MSAGLILAIMVLPYITAISFDVCRAVPSAQRQGALALGATRWQMIRSVVLPYARPGILAACFLALGRALGETMAVTMLIGNVRYLNFSVAARGDSIASVIAGQLHEADDRTRAALIALGLILFLITGADQRRSAGTSSGWPAGRARHEATDRRSRPSRPPPPPPESLDARQRRAERPNRVMTGVLAACQVLTVVPLFLILGYIVFRGAPQVDANLFTRAAGPAGAAGRRARARHARQPDRRRRWRARSPCPVGILAAVFLSEYRDQPARQADPVHDRVARRGAVDRDRHLRLLGGDLPALGDATRTGSRRGRPSSPWR